MRLLKLLGWGERRICPLEERDRATTEILFAHLYDSMMPMILAHDGPVITTRRTEKDIRDSWIRRGKDLRELGRQLDNYRALLSRKPYVMELGWP